MSIFSANKIKTMSTRDSIICLGDWVKCNEMSTADLVVALNG